MLSWSWQRKRGLDRVYIHCFMDGRDVPPDSARGYMEQLEAKLQEIGVGKIASVSGRYYAMDRDNRWEQVQKAYDAIAKSEGEFNEAPWPPCRRPMMQA